MFCAFIQLTTINYCATFVIATKSLGDGSILVPLYFYEAIITCTHHCLKHHYMACSKMILPVSMLVYFV